MKRIHRKRKGVKLTIILFFGLLTITVLFLNGRQKADASAQGPSPSHTNAPNEDNCTACHVDHAVNSGTGSVQILVIPQTYQPGQQIPITVTTSQAGAVVYGFQLTALDQSGKTAGTFTLPTQNPAQIQIVNNIVGGQPRKYVEHTVDGILPTQFDSKSWTFTWTAPNPSAGQIDFYAAGNSANSDGTTSGDYIYTTTKSLPEAQSFSISGRILSSDGVRGLRNVSVVLTDPNNVTKISTTSSFGLYSFTDVSAGQTYNISVKSKLFRFANQSVTVSDNLTNFDFIGLE